MRCVFGALMMLAAGSPAAWAQAPVEITTEVEETDHTEKTYFIQSYQNTAYYLYPVSGSGNHMNTRGILDEKAEFYFLDAGTEADVQYYYIVNKNSGKYLYASANTSKKGITCIDYNAGNDDKYKFGISAATGISAYNIFPKGNTALSLNKQTGNWNTKGDNAEDVFLYATFEKGKAVEGSSWNFILTTSYSWTLLPECFNLSSAGDSHYYYIQNNSTKRYMVPGTTYVESATKTDDNDAQARWYFLKAASDDYIDYYYIVNVNGDYLYTTGTQGTDAVNNVVSLKGHTTAGGLQEERFQFIVVRGAMSNESHNDPKKITFTIIPRVFKDVRSENYWGLEDNSAGPLRTFKERNGNDKCHWNFISASPICETPVITYTGFNQLTISSATDGATIYYTTDGTTPTTSSNVYSGPITITAGMTAIKAIATKADYDPSVVATQALATYTYKIVNRSNVIAATSEEVQQAAGTPLSGYTGIPESIRSSYLADETVTFYAMDGDFNAANLDAEHRITETPAASATIYVTYTTTHLSEKFLPLTNASPYNLREDSDYLYGNGGLGRNASATEDNKKSNDYLWYFLGSDPYDVTVQNVGKSNYLNYTSLTLSLNTAQTFILKNLTGSDTSSRNVTLRNASGEEVTLTVNTVVLPLSFTLIDKAGKIIESNINYGSSFALPAAWQSPLVSQYKFYKKYTSLTDGVYTFDEADRIYSVENREDNVIYVTYDVNDDLDLDGGFNRESGGKTYMLEFANGVPFYQENGSDGLMETTLKPIYPYSNGDATLYIYGSDRWNTQLANGATTRTRWLWYLEPALKVNGEYVLDPYHVRISSYQNQTNYTDPATKVIQANFHSYLRTFKPEGYSAVVTGTTNNNPLTIGLEASATALTGDELPAGTEYMLIGTSLNSLKLVTAKAISDGSTTERRTVTSFEQYWKNSPTVQNKLTNKVTSVGRNVTLSDTQKTEVEAMTMNGDTLGWHVYADWANSAPWLHNNDATSGGSPTTSKKFLNEEHVFQTINMGDGSFRFVETELTPMLILLDLHGWEIMRLPLTAAKEADRKKYNSPMVQEYHWYATGSKVPGYHKFTVSGDPQYTTTTLDFTPEDGTDFYVTYTVKPEYARTYSGAATKAGTSASRFLVKQGDNYAKISGTSLSAAPAPLPETIGDELQWYLRPNFDIDLEMGYLYAGETGAQEEALSQENTEIQNHSEGRNGFDPYNLQIQSVANVNRYFTADTKDSEVGSTWSGETTEITLENMAVGQSDIIGLDQVKMNITNATFMVVADANGRMVLMPRFDHTKVVNSLTDPQLAATGTNTYSLTVSPVPTVVNRSSEIQAMGGTYVLSSSFTVDETIGTADAPFQGTIDGQMITISSLTTPFIAYAQDAVIKNIIVDNVGISSGSTAGNVGAIVCETTGNTRIYNVGINGGSVSGSNYVGGLVGLLDGYSRVINCYSYAEITGGSRVGGIVGYNNFQSSSLVNATTNNLRTMVMNCMFYGNISGGKNKAPIYNGRIISNRDANGLSNFNYFLADQPYVQNDDIDTYNCALMAETRYLQRFEFFRLLLNSNLKLAGWWATGEYSKSEMMKWVLETADRSIDDPKPYPVLKTPGKYPSIINIDAANAPSSGERNTGTKLGTLSVTISGPGSGAVYGSPSGASITTSSLTLDITDKDFDRYNFNYRKVQLPYYNDVGTGNYTKASDETSRVVTGWKIISITGGTPGTFKEEDSAEGYNFADRNCTNKDLYSVSKRVFNQGAYWDVPDGVTAITIEPYWAKAAYLADAYADVVYNQGMGTSYDVPRVGGGQIYTNNTKYSIAGEEQTVYTSSDNARDNLKLDASHTVYDHAIVLVGNYHKHNGVTSSNASHPYTIMSADFDHDNEPDYSFIQRFDGRVQTHPVRVDFLNIPGLGMAQKSTGGTGTYNFGILQPIGWFESTNTSLFRVTQFEYDRSDRVAAPIIVQGGVMEQWVSGQANGYSNKTTYFHVGGNAWFKEFHRGTHQDKDYTSKHPPISVTGGDYNEFYLTGLYRGDVDNYEDNAECYISGGRFGVLAGAAMEGLGKTGGADNTGNITWQIQHADIDEFYGGGFNAAHPVEGNITTTITGGYIHQFCGGPKFGDMNPGKTVTTTATDCTFDTFYGAGYGGNSYSRFAPFNVNNINGDYGTSKWNTFLNNNYKQEYNSDYKGVSTTYTSQYIPMSNNTQSVARILIDFVSFSLARTRNVTSTLTNCTINEDFYGGGNLGKVEGNVTSTLNGGTVKGNVYGAGYGGSTPVVDVMNTGGFATAPRYDGNLGAFFDPVFPATVPYTWQHRDETIDNTDKAIDKTNHILYTNEDLNTLGTVTGQVVLNVVGTAVGGNVDSGNVYGGGALSDVAGDIGAVEVNISSGSMTDVYGGGKGKNTVVSGNIVVNIGAKSGEGELSGTGDISGDVYGGSAFGAVGASSTKDANGDVTAYTPTEGKTSQVNIYGGSIGGSVFGGGLGQLAVGTSGNPGYEAPIDAKNFGNAVVNMEGGTVTEAVYGGANINGVLKADATVTLLGGTVGTERAAGAAVKDAVFGGGKGEPTLVEGGVTVNVGSLTGTTYAGTATIHGNVYGGSALGNTAATRVGEELSFNAAKPTAVNLYGGTINGDVYGGGLGQKAVAAQAAVGTEGDEGYKPAVEAVAGIESFVGGDVHVLLDGAKVHQIFGANNLNGTPKGHVRVWVKRTVGSDKSSTEALALTRDERDSRANTYDVAAVYGGGNQADYIPTNALLDPKEAEGNQALIDAATAEVIIDGCDDTSIQYVYGGGNAAAVPATDVKILGDYIIQYVFGGGNGKGERNPGANIGTYDNGTTEYGTGKASTQLVGGHIIYVFGGSDTKGNVRGGTSITMPETSLYPTPTYDCCAVRDIKQIYGAGNEAEQDGTVTLILGCVDNMDYVYGGARNADVKGGVDLVVTSGHFTGVYGGNDLSGTIQGPITVTIEETGCAPLEIDNLYLGGNQAAYSIYGYKDNGSGKLVARTAAEYEALTAEQKTELGLPYADPVLNIVSCTRIGKETGDDLGGAFGGGYGAGAIMYGNPTVNVNMIAGKYAKRIDRDGNGTADNDATALGIIRNVYGGGEQANVEGNTTVNIATAETVTVRTSMGAAVTNEPTPVQGALITENVFGAGKGLDTDVNSALVTGNTTITMAGGMVQKSVYGGGQLSQVGGNTTITVSGGTIGTTGLGGATYGNIYGGGFGDVSNAQFGQVKGNTHVMIQDDAAVLHNVYGGGAYGSVGTYSYAAGVTTCAEKTGTANITITGGTVGTDGHENGMVFGSSRGDVTKPTGEPALDPNDRLAWVNNTNVVIGTTNDETAGPAIKGSVYGSGENGHTYHDTSVEIHSGTIGITDPDIDGGAAYAFRGNVYGGGCGTDQYDSDNDGGKDAYNPKSGIVQGNTTVLIDGGHVVHNVYGAGAMGSVDGTTSVTIAGSARIGVDGSANANGYVYAAAKGDASLDDAHQAYVGSTLLTISGGTVWGDAFGGGQSGIVKGAVAVNLTGGTLKQDVYGGGALAKVNTEYDAEHPYTTAVNLSGAAVTGSVYGGGLGRRVASDAVLYTAEDDEVIAGTKNVGDVKTPAMEAVAADVNGPVTVTVTSGKAANVFGCNNLNGAPQQTVAVAIKGTDTPIAPVTYGVSNVYGGGNQAAYTGTPTVTVARGYVNNVYGGGLGTTAVIQGGTAVTISGGTVVNDVYGGGSQADVTGSVAVTVSGGTVVNNVYGGGALANTNTANWDEERLETTYEKISKTLTAGETVVTGLYKKVGEEYILQGSGAKAEGGAEYYRIFETAWAEGKTSASNTTTVTLTGGTLGNAFGGGLGDNTTPVYVYGDVTVNVNKADDLTATGGTGVAFTRELAQNVSVDGKNYPSVPVTGSIFGANNFNGTPKGNVKVEIWGTKRTDGKAHVIGDYEVQAVYGGGNMADYLPAAGKQTEVVIHGCASTSIEKVYGGGNSASVPSTHVTILGAFDIGYAFGGGNGSRPLKNSAGVWQANGGAMVTGNSSIVAKGGRIGQVFGGSDAKGDILGSPSIDTKSGGGECDLTITRIFGAGNEANVIGDVNILLSGCSTADAVQFVHGGSYNAHISGDVNLTITSGVYTNVFGGNDARGGIGGNITVNIEETDECKPIIIHNLVGAGNEAPYPGTKEDGKTEYSTSGRVTINVKSATRIDNIYGGGLKADVKGDTYVNINMIKGSQVGQLYTLPPGYTGDPVPNIVAGVIKDEIGTIGNVFGGGNEGNVIGHTYVNIGTEKKIDILKRVNGAIVDAQGDSVYNYKGEQMYDDDGAGNKVARVAETDEKDVVGVHITGDVVGGANLAYVGKYNVDTDEVETEGNTHVNICVRYDDEEGVNKPVEGTDVTIAGNVYGGGRGKADTFKCEKGMVTGGTNVLIGNGTIGGTVYGGGEAGRVEGNTVVTIGIATGTSAPDIAGCVYGAGKGVSTHGYSALVRGNSTVTIQGSARIGQSVYGGGELASVGQYNIADEDYHAEHPEVEVGMPYSLADSNKGICTVTIQGNAEIGPDNMTMPTFSGHVFGAGKGELPYEGLTGSEKPRRMIPGNLWEEYTDEDAYLKYVETLALATKTNVTIDGNAFVKGSVYGGSENGHVQHNTQVTIQGTCQIGAGYKNGASLPKYAEAAFIDPTSTEVTASNALDECASWTYGQAAVAAKKHLPYDPYADEYATFPEGERDDFLSSKTGDDGHTYYGNVFGGGSGKEPYRAGKWHKEAGSVGGNTTVNITGGHILTSVYGGNEVTDVKGSCTVSMSGGTLGVPRTLEQIAAHPVTCYLFGAGKGDQRTHFNTWTNVASTTVTVSGGTIYGSVFGGGEDGHVLGDATVNIRDAAKIGTWGTSYVDGNVFGGGRGFSGLSLTAGSVGGNVDVNITGGTMLGSVYGGGRMAAVGVTFEQPFLEDGTTPNPMYGLLKDETGEEGNPTYGHVRVNISGGVIGKDFGDTTPDGMEHSGNVFGGSMGRNTLLNGAINPYWPKIGVVKLTDVTISGGTIYRNVYGGCELAVVRNQATVTVSNGTVYGSVFGGGYGSDDHTTRTSITAGGYSSIPTKYFTFTPMIWNGCVSGNTSVNISGGQVKQNVYGGGYLASVGLINFNSDASGNWNEEYLKKHDDLTNGFALSWPYEFQYIAAAPTDAASGGGLGNVGGKALVNVTGGRVGGSVFGGSKGQVAFDGVTSVGDHRYVEAFCANVRETEVKINYSETPESDDGSTTACIVGRVYGGGQDGHVYENAAVSITGGLIGQSVYGGGEGESTYKGQLRDQSTEDLKAETEDLMSWTAGKVYGNTSVTMTGGHVMINVYGGGHMASVGKGNYAGGTDDYYPAGYGETLTGNLWTSATEGDGFSADERDDAWHFLNSGKATVTITGGTVGSLNGVSGTVFGTSDPTPTGMVFGGSRGQAAQDVTKNPRYEYAPNFYLGYVNETEVTIGTAEGGPRIFSQVFGGGRDGHVRGNTHVIVNNGTIGQTFAETSDDYQRYHRGNVYGSGSGLGVWDGTHHGMSSGSVTRNTTVDIYGGTIYNNVYGGGALSSVGPPKITMPDYAAANWSKCTVNIHGGTIGNAEVYNEHQYGGCVYGASRGADFSTGESPDDFATVLWTKVNVEGGTIAGNVYGGAKGGRVKKDTEVNLKGGSIAHDAFGGGQGTRLSGANMEGIAADVGGNATVKLNEGVGGTSKGCSVRRVFGCNDMNGSPKGHVLVHVYATQHPNRTAHATMSSKYPQYANIDDYTITNYSDLTDLAETVGVNVSAYKTILKGSADDDTKKQALTDMREAISLKKYDVQAVYGGGNLAPYTPTDAYSDNEATRAAAFAEVIIDGCQLTSIMEVYGNGNAAPTPASRMTVNGCYEIDELFGGGNGYDNYEIDGTCYENPGANVGYHNYAHYVKFGETGYDKATHGSGTKADPYKAIDNGDATSKEYRIANYAYGSGEAHTDVFGGRIHSAYGGSNMVGNIRFLAMSSYDSSSDCPSNIDHTYAGGNKADMDGKAELLAKCVGYMHKLYGGNTNADYNNDILMTITNGVFGTVIGGNDQGGKVSGSITINIKEGGCNPIIIDKLYGGGYEAGYSIYGYNKSDGSPRTKEDYDRDLAAAMATISEADKDNETVKNNALIEAGLFGFPKASPRINIISATKIGEVYGGGYNSVVVGNPTINVNMEEGQVLKEYVDKHPEDFTVDTHTLTTKYHEGGIDVEREDDYAVVGSVAEGLAAGNAILKVGTIGTIFGGGNEADVLGNTTVEIGTGSWFNYETRTTETIERKAAFVLGNVYGGGRMGHVGNFTKTDGRPTSCVDGTGIARVVISNGEIGPDDMKMYHANGSGVIPADDKPDDSGHVFGGGMGTNLPADDNAAFVDSTEVIVNGTAWVKGSVFGGGENGHVLHNAGVKIGGNSQIGNGHILIRDGNSILLDQGINRPYTDEEWAARHLILGDGDLPGVSDELKTSARTMYANSLPECHSWEYKAPYAPYDKYAGTGGYDAKGGAKIATSGRAFNGNVFGGGSGFFPYEPGQWNDNAGKVYGDSWVEISGGHILTSAYGGCEMSSMGGDTHVTMTGGTLGVPRTLSEIAAHPVTCYLFGGGKGDQRVFFNRSTDVMNAYVNVLGGTVYGSVFGGGEDGHVMRNVYMTIGKADGTGPKIGTWGTSYVEGNVFGGGRGYSGDAYTAGNVSGSVRLDIKGGEMLGSVYGGGRLGSVGYGLYLKGEDGYGTMRPDGFDRDGTTPIADFKRGYIDLTISGGTIGNKLEFIYPQESNIPTGVPADFKTWTDADWTTWKQHNHVPNTTYDRATGRVTHTKGGNVFAGSMGRRMNIAGTAEISAVEWQKLGNVKQTDLTIKGTPWIMGNVYGGCELGAVTPYSSGDTKEGGNTTITIQGGTIGTEVTATEAQQATVTTPGTVKYTFGSVYGGGMGEVYTNGSEQKVHDGGNVSGNTTITISGDATAVRASVYGGGEVATVGGNTRVSISGGEIGRNEVKPKDGDDPGYVLFGGASMGNVYGGGQGHVEHTEAGLVKGNTTVNISGGSIYHNVYGGGALGSVGTFYVRGVNDATVPTPGVPDGVPYWTVDQDGTHGANGTGAETGQTTVTITGGTIGISGRDNGMVFGSSRGDITAPTGTPALDPYDKVAWVRASNVTIGTDGGDRTTPHIKGSVYGGAENGHNYQNATVNVLSGTIGIPDIKPGTVDEPEPWWDFGTEGRSEEDRTKFNTEYRAYRGNVYGAGSGSDTYWVDDNKDGKIDLGEEHHNPRAGMVGGSTVVNIKGGHIGRSVYGAGSMASLGNITNVTDTIHGGTGNHNNENDGFALSWPYRYEFAPNTGKVTVNVTGGHIGTKDVDGGDIYGSARGEAGDRYSSAHLAYANETVVNINYPETAVMTSEDDIHNNYDLHCITGSVHGSGEDGFVYGDAQVTLNNGLIGHSLYGAGKGKGTYTQLLRNIGSTEDYHKAKIYSLIAGKVFGNTYVTMNGGHVVRNVYGGGNMGSVGKGNYASGTDDYYPDGYGEKIDEDLWTPSDGFDPNKPIKLSTTPGPGSTNEPSTWADYFLSSGKATVKVLGGTVGYIDPTNPATSVKDNLPYGNVFGGSAGEAAPNILNNPRYLYCPAFFSGYVNETDVTIGKAATAAEGTEGEEGYIPATPASGPTILGSVYGGGQDGHVRRDAKVTVYAGEIGLPFTSDNQTRLKTTDPLNDQWLHRGNVYGAGSGISKYAYDFNYDNDTADKEIDYTNPLNGAESKIDEEDYSNSAGSVTRFTRVDIKGGTIHRNVYGGGSNGSVGAPTIPPTRADLPLRFGDTQKGWQSFCQVNVWGTVGTPKDYPGYTFNPNYGGEVFGGSRGQLEALQTEEAKSQFATTIWTEVNVFEGAHILNNVFGGGDAGMVKKDSEVLIGGKNKKTDTDTP